MRPFPDGLKKQKHFAGQACSVAATVLVLAMVMASCDETAGGTPSGVSSTRVEPNTGTQGTSPTVSVATSNRGLQEVPRPNLSSVEPAVREAILEQRANLDETIARKHVADLDLGVAYGKTGVIYDRYSLKQAARACYENARKLAPKDYRWTFYLGLLSFDEGRLEEAADYYRETNRQNSGYVPALVRLGDVETDRTNYAAAKSAYDKALALDPKCARAYYSLGRLCAEQGKWAEAASNYERARVLAPYATEILYPLGLAYRYIGRTDDARKLMEAGGKVRVPLDDPLRHALQEEVVGWRRFQNVGTTLVQQGRLLEAEEAFSKAIAAAPTEERFLPLSNRGAVRVMVAEQMRGTKGYWAKLDQARADLDQALKLPGANARSYYNHGRVLAMFGRDDQAIVSYAKSIEFKPEQHESHMNMANALRRLGRFEEALGHYQKVVSQFPAEEDARLAVALTLIRLHRYDEARATLEESILVLPDSLRVKATYARLVAARPRSATDSTVAVKVVLKLENLRHQAGHKSRDLRYAVTRAMAYSHQGRFDEAKELLNVCLKAVRRIKRTDIEARLMALLSLVEQKKPITTPWEDDHPTLSPQPLEPAPPEEYRK